MKRYPYQIGTMAEYQNAYAESLNHPDQFWSGIAENFVWHRKWDKVLDWNFKEPAIRWFEGAQLNITENCLDRHAAATPDRIALIWEPNHPQEAICRYTYAELLQAVNQCARYSSDPKTDHWVAVMRILRYLNGTRDYGLFYHRHMSQYDGVNALNERVRTSNIKQPFAYSSAYFPGTTLANLQEYSDADFANSVDDKCSITGYVFMFA
jgi:hypothetical protein